MYSSRSTSKSAKPPSQLKEPMSHSFKNGATHAHSHNSVLATSMQPCTLNAAVLHVLHHVKGITPEYSKAYH
eukprot:1161180-Pelagomonas_calceolata.AAC.9